MAEITIGPFTIPIRWLRWAVVEPLRAWAGTRGLKSDIGILQRHVAAMTEILHIVVAQISGGWTAEQRERVQRAMTNFSNIGQGLGHLRTKGNPLTREEISTLKDLTARLEQGGALSPEEAASFRRLADVVAREYPDEDWVVDLLKLAMFAFSVYTVSQVFKEKED